MNKEEQLETVQQYLEMMALGINPFDGTPIPQGELLHDVRVSRCLFLAAEMLRSGEKGTKKREKKPKKATFSISAENLAMFEPDQDGITVSELVRLLNDLAENDPETTKKLGTRAIFDFLCAVGLLKTLGTEGGRTKRVVTEDGKKMGIFAQMREGPQGNYAVNLLSAEVQQLIVDNLPAIAGQDEEA